VIELRLFWDGGQSFCDDFVTNIVKNLSQSG